MKQAGIFSFLLMTFLSLVAGSPKQAWAQAGKPPERIRDLSRLNSNWFSLAVSPDDKAVVYGGRSGVVVAYDTAKMNQLRVFSTQGMISEPVRSLDFSPDGDTLVAGIGNDIRAWEFATGKVLFTITAAMTHTLGKSSHGGYVASVAVTRDGRHLVAGGGRAVKSFNMQDGTPHKTFWKSFTDHVTWMAMSPNGRLLAFSQKHKIELFDFRTGKKLREWSQSVHNETILRFTPDSRHLAAAWTPVSGKPAVVFFDVENGNRTLEVPLQFAPRQLVITRDNRNFLIADSRNMILAFVRKSGKELVAWQAHTATLHALGVDFAAERIYSADEHSHMRVWKAPWAD